MTRPNFTIHILPSHPDTRRLFEAFCAGFAATGEGWNGEYPFQDQGREIADDERVIEEFAKWDAERRSKRSGR